MARNSCAFVSRGLAGGSAGKGVRQRARWRRDHSRQSFTSAALLLLGVLAGACSIAVNAERQQCVTDADCRRRGGPFADSVCDVGLCREERGQSDDDDDATCREGDDCDEGSVTGERDACSGTRCPDAGKSRDAESDKRDAESEARDARARPESDGPDETPSERDAGDDAQGAERPPPSDVSSDGGPDVEVDPASECTVDDDCRADGGADAVCVERVCWSSMSAPMCAADDDCAALGPEFEGGRCVASSCRPNPRWRCEQPTRPESGLLELTILVRDSLSLDPLPGVRALVCKKLDLNCVEPIAETTSNDDGYFVFSVPHDFAGYLQVEERRFGPALYFFPASLPSDGVLQPMPLLGAGLINTLALSLGARIDAQRGHMMLIAEDCFGMPLSGFVFASAQPDAGTVQFYVRDLLPSVAAKDTGEVGNGGFLNFPAGNAIITVREPKSMLELTTASIVVRPGFISVAYLRPDPR